METNSTLASRIKRCNGKMRNANSVPSSWLIFAKFCSLCQYPSTPCNHHQFKCFWEKFLRRTSLPKVNEKYFGSQRGRIYFRTHTRCLQNFDSAAWVLFLAKVFDHWRTDKFQYYPYRIKSEYKNENSAIQLGLMMSFKTTIKMHVLAVYSFLSDLVALKSLISYVFPPWVASTSKHPKFRPKK